jgi:acetyl-CoA carboxylase carboxyl transferase subunit alpha
MAMPEGYRKAVRLMEMADRFNLPVITLIDTAGAYPGRRGGAASQAIAGRRTAASHRVPLIAG